MTNIKRESKKSHKSKNRLPGRIQETYCECVQWKNHTNNKSKVVIIGNNHFKGSVLRIGNYLSAKFEVCGLIKPGAGLENILGKTVIDSFTLTKNDVLVFSGGVNDVYNNNSKQVILQIVKFYRTIAQTY